MLLDKKWMPNLLKKSEFLPFLISSITIIFSYVFPSMESMPSIVQSVVAHFGFKTFIGFGIGAGANVLLRYAVCYSFEFIFYFLIQFVLA